jgi:hypothetical protein
MLISGVNPAGLREITQFCCPFLGLGSFGNFTICLVNPAFHRRSTRQEYLVAKGVRLASVAKSLEMNEQYFN